MHRVDVEHRAPSPEDVRKNSRILVIDDHAFPAERLFKRDNYHIERWPNVRNLNQLTDGHHSVILLDIHGVGLNESPELQGLGILKHVKRANPAQPVILYSSQPQMISRREYLILADAVLDKSAEYVEYKTAVDDLLVRRMHAGYFVGVMNRELGDRAVLAPKAVKLASRSIRSGDPEILGRYLRRQLPDVEQVDRILAVISIATGITGLVA